MQAQNKPNWIYDSKRMVGKEITEETVVANLKHWDFNVVEGQTKNCEIDCGAAGRYKVEEVSSHILT